jgi:hypothetical protein
MELISPRSISQVEDLEQINAQIHDSWFDIEQISFSADSGVLEIPLGEGMRAKGLRIMERPPSDFPWLLTLYGVSDLEIEDQADIGSYDIDQLEFRPGTGQLILYSGFPFKLSVRVDRGEFKAEIREADKGSR